MLHSTGLQIVSPLGAARHGNNKNIYCFSDYRTFKHVRIITSHFLIVEDLFFWLRKRPSSHDFIIESGAYRANQRFVVRNWHNSFFYNTAIFSIRLYGFQQLNLCLTRKYLDKRKAFELRSSVLNYVKLIVSPSF